MTDGSQPSDVELARSAADGDSRAFASLVDRHAPVCLRFATRMLGNREDAEEVTQDALLRAHRALARYDGSTAFRTWLMAILVNRCRSAALYRSRREERVMISAEAVARATVEPAVPTDLRERLEIALGRLDADQREAFLLKHVEALSYEEMSVATGAGVSALKMRVKRASDRLRALLESDHE